MSHPVNTILAERNRESYFRKDEITRPIPEKYLLNGEPIYSDKYLKELIDEEWEEELKAEDKDIF